MAISPIVPFPDGSGWHVGVQQRRHAAAAVMTVAVAMAVEDASGALRVRQYPPLCVLTFFVPPFRRELDEDAVLPELRS